MPRLVRITTPSRLTGSGPKKEAYTPGTLLSPFTWASFSRAARKPPWLWSTARITAAIPASMMIPWIKSLMAVAI